jgi:hypothetical protein
MAWRYQSIANTGQYVYAVTVSGFNLDFFGRVSNAEMMDRLRQYVTGVELIQVQIKRELFSGEVRVFGRAVVAKPLDGFAAEVEAAINSFWTIGGVRVSVFANDNLSDPPPSDYSGLTESLKWATIGIVAIVVLAAIIQGKKVLE